jgi:hypothetical protein
MSDREDFLSQCDCCGELKYGCIDVVAYGLDTHACPACRGHAEDDDEAADRGDFEFHRDYDQ